MSSIFRVRKITSPSDFMNNTKYWHAHIWKDRAICDVSFFHLNSDIVRHQLLQKEKIWAPLLSKFVTTVPLSQKI